MPRGLYNYSLLRFPNQRKSRPISGLWVPLERGQHGLSECLGFVRRFFKFWSQPVASKQDDNTASIALVSGNPEPS
ncbi:MAG: hypothetical protein H7Z11_23900 [Verrucomicrobia bacterium]|nr:hypothetical protein [Leptolyngbya sp. ES-bin-22]